MTQVRIPVTLNDQILYADLDEGYCIAIPLDHTAPQLNAYFAPLYEASPVIVGTWTGDTREGGSVNFYNIRLNPHGNGTHTECAGHISRERYFVHQALGPGRWIAQLISVYPVQKDNGDRVVEALHWDSGIEALIIRTMPNHPEKMFRQYGGTNPPYVAADELRKMADQHIQHLLIDLPSVDREEDGGLLAGHHAFWKYPHDTRHHATITELVYIDNVIPDGLYLLEIQIPAMQLDAAPSRPFIYPLR